MILNFKRIFESYFEPLFQVREEENEIIVHIDLPCVKKEDIQIAVNENSIEIRAKMTQESIYADVKLPWQVVPEKTRAKFRGGILEIKLPKGQKRTRIKVD